MKASVISALAGLVLCLAIPQSLPAQVPMPSIKVVDPGAGKIGDTIKATGENLEKKHVTQMFLTDGKIDLPCQITEQTATAIAFKIPAKAQPMRYSLLILTTGKEPKLIEQPVKVEVQQ
jgi:hypothetical protein